MAKGIVKGISQTSNPINTTTIVETDGGQVSNKIGYDGTLPAGGIVSGTITDSQSGLDVEFQAAFGAEIGLAQGLKVNYKTVVVGGVTIANCVKLLERGVIETINLSNDGGTLRDKATKTSIPFAQTYCNEMGLQVGSKVSFERVIDPKTASYIAVCIEL